MKEVLLYMHIILVKHADNLCFNCKFDFKLPTNFNENYGNILNYLFQKLILRLNFKR